MTKMFEERAEQNRKLQNDLDLLNLDMETLNSNVRDLESKLKAAEETR